MSFIFDPPVYFRRRDGSVGQVDVPIGDWPYPVFYDEGGVEVVVSAPSRDWERLGWCPTPRTRWGWFRQHLLEGLLMRYPVLDVIVFAWRNREVEQEAE